jgi:hypothetical protein
MRRLLAAFTALILAPAMPLHAEESPWCVRLDVFTRNCAFASYNECVAVAKNANPEAACIRNPGYQPPAAAASPKPAPAKTSNPQR